MNDKSNEIARHQLQMFFFGLIVVVSYAGVSYLVLPAAKSAWYVVTAFFAIVAIGMHIYSYKKLRSLGTSRLDALADSFPTRWNYINVVVFLPIALLVVFVLLLFAGLSPFEFIDTMIGLIRGKY